MIPHLIMQFMKDALAFHTYGSLFIKSFLRLPTFRYKKTMDCYQDDFVWNLKPRKALRVIIVGAGISGLATAIALDRIGHHVIVLDRLPRLEEIGAGLQLTPNASRILGRLGILEQIDKYAHYWECLSLRRWQDGRVIGSSPLMPQIGMRYKAPLYAIHRCDLQRVLLDAVKEAGIPVWLNQNVCKIDPSFSARVQLNSGEWIEGDVLIGADGIKSQVRSRMAAASGIQDRAVPTGDAAYRVLIPREKMKEDPEAMSLLDGNFGVRWMGPDGHIVGYPVKQRKYYNMVLLHPQKPDGENTESWTHKGHKSEMVAFYRDWNPLVQKLISFVPEGEIMEWTLNTHFPLPRWTENQCVLVGDACHPMLPYVAQGAAQALEDAAALAVTLSLTGDVPLALRVYECARKKRAETIQDSAARTRMTLHLPDGPEQEARDLAMGSEGENPDLFVDTSWQDYLWKTDVMKDTLEGWDEYVAEVLGDPNHCDNISARL